MQRRMLLKHNLTNELSKDSPINAINKYQRAVKIAMILKERSQGIF